MSSNTVEARISCCLATLRGVALSVSGRRSRAKDDVGLFVIEVMWNGSGGDGARSSRSRWHESVAGKCQHKYGSEAEAEVVGA